MWTYFFRLPSVFLGALVATAPVVHATGDLIAIPVFKASVTMVCRHDHLRITMSELYTAPCKPHCTFRQMLILVKRYWVALSPQAYDSLGNTSPSSGATSSRVG